MQDFVLLISAIVIPILFLFLMRNTSKEKTWQNTHLREPEPPRSKPPVKSGISFSDANFRTCHTSCDISSPSCISCEFYEHKVNVEISYQYNKQGELEGVCPYICTGFNCWISRESSSHVCDYYIPMRSDNDYNTPENRVTLEVLAVMVDENQRSC